MSESAFAKWKRRGFPRLSQGQGLYVNHHREIIEFALRLARMSPCVRKRFGCVAVIDYNGQIYGGDYNRPLPVSRHLQTPHCIRHEIVSRTQSLLGCCFHAEELVTRSLMTWQAIPPYHFSDMIWYVLGLPPDDDENPIDYDEYTCLRCATLAQNIGLKGIAWWRWPDGIELGERVIVSADGAYTEAIKYYQEGWDA